MKNIIKKNVYAMAFPLVLAAYGHAQPSAIEQLASQTKENHIIIDANQLNAPKPTSAVYNPDFKYPAENLGTTNYDLDMCVKDSSKLDKLIFDFTYYSKKEAASTFYIQDIWPGAPIPTDPNMRGGFRVRMSTGTVGYEIDINDPVKAYNVTVRDMTRTIKRDYKFTFSDVYKKGRKSCINVKIALTDSLVNSNLPDAHRTSENKLNFGDLLPGRK